MKEILQIHFIIFDNIINISLSYSDLGQKVNESILEELVTIAQENKEERKEMYNEAAERQERLLHILENITNKM